MERSVMTGCAIRSSIGESRHCAGVPAPFRLLFRIFPNHLASNCPFVQENFTTPSSLPRLASLLRICYNWNRLYLWSIVISRVSLSGGFSTASVILTFLSPLKNSGKQHATTRFFSHRRPGRIGRHVSAPHKFRAGKEKSENSVFQPLPGF